MFGDSIVLDYMLHDYLQDCSLIKFLKIEGVLLPINMSSNIYITH